MGGDETKRQNGGKERKGKEKSTRARDTGCSLRARTLRDASGEWMACSNADASGAPIAARSYDTTEKYCVVVRGTTYTRSSPFPSPPPKMLRWWE